MGCRTALFYSFQGIPQPDLPMPLSFAFLLARIKKNRTFVTS